MAKIELRLSSLADKVTGKHQVLLRIFDGRSIDFRSKSGIYISSSHFRYFINREKSRKNGITIPDRVVSATIDEAKKKGYSLRTSGEVFFSERRITPELEKERKDAETLEKLKLHIAETLQCANPDEVSSEWLEDVINRFHCPVSHKEHSESIYVLMEQYLQKKNFSHSHTKAYRVLMRDMGRYEAFCNKLLHDNFSWNIDNLTKEDIEDFEDFLRNEIDLAEKYKNNYDEILEIFPPEIHTMHKSPKLQIRGDNTIIKLMKRLKSFLRWLYETEKTQNRSFETIQIGAEKYGTPFYLTKEERNFIADANLKQLWDASSDDFKKEVNIADFAALETQKDIFVFQCLVGCRVGDLQRLTEKNITNGILEYVPSKTEDEDAPVKPRIPLNECAIALVEKYKGRDNTGHLFPFISPQKYNLAIKKIFKICGITRNIQWRNPKTGETEMKRICDVASSHMARRTFVGAAYKAVKDPSIVGRMSGHVEGSRAFARYRDIDDDILKETIAMI